MLPEDQYITINNIKTRYWTAGDTGSVILLVHGFASSVEYWMYNISELATKHRVYALDMVGFGRSDKPKIKYSAAVLSKFVYDFLIAKKINKLNLIGHSLGGAVCLQFAIDYPQMLSKLILVDSAGFGQEIPLGLRILSIPLLGSFLLKFDQKEVLAKALRAYSYNKAALSDEFIDKMHAILKLPGTKRALLLMLRQHANIFGIKLHSIKPILDNLRHIKVPTLVIWGRQDNMLPSRHSQIAIYHLPNAKLHVFDKCGHVPQMEVRDKFNKLVLEYLQSKPTGTPDISKG